MIALLLKWTGLPQWAMELVFIGLLGIGFLIYHRHVLDDGIAKQQAADNAASKILLDKAASETADAKARATMAEQANAKENSSIPVFIDAHPESVRLCSNAHGSSGSVPASGTKDTGHAGAGAGPASVQPVPDGNSGSGQGGSGVDIGPLLQALAGSADKVSSELREYQSQ